MIDELMTRLDETLLTWPGVHAEPGRFQSTVYRLGRREIGHLHRNGVADLPFPRAIHDELIAAGRAQPHQAGVPGFVSFRIAAPEDVNDALALFRLNYDRAQAATGSAGRE